MQEGEQYLSSPNKAELKLREQKKFPENVRLACQTKVIASNVKIQRIIKDEADLDLYVYGKSSENIQTVGDEKSMALFFLDIRAGDFFRTSEAMPLEVQELLGFLEQP